MKQLLRILIVDDHPMTIWGYKYLLENLQIDHRFETEGAENCDDVISIMKRHKHDFYDIVMLDISLPASKDGSVMSGEDLGQRIHQKFPMTKIIVHTSLNDQQRIANIFKSLNPVGFLIKSDIVPEVLSDSIKSVVNGQTYYSEQTNRLIAHHTDQEIFLDTADQKILYHLSQGERMKDLPKHIHFSMATIERRKKRLKILFGLPDGRDKELLDIAREKGFI